LIQCAAPEVDGLDVSAADELGWRLMPHTLAAHVLPNSFKLHRLADFLGRQIAEAVYRGGGRLIINVAPRQGKSEVVSFATPTWFLDNWPGKRVILASHTADLSLEYGRRVRNEFATNPRLTTRLRDDSKAANRWNTPAGGGMKTVGVGGAIVGFGGDLILVDDAHKNWAEAHSPLIRRRINEWFDATLISRLEPNGTIIVVMQRWDQDDLTGHLIRGSKEHWTVFRLPAIAGENDPMGRIPGEAVCPERFDIDALQAIQAARPKVVWDAMYDQSPSPDGEGRAYTFCAADHVDSSVRLRFNLPLQLAFDFNKNPGVHVEIGQYDQRADLFTVRHEVFGERQGTPETMVALIGLFKREGIIAAEGQFNFPGCEVFGDRSGKSENTVTSDTDYILIERALRDAGISPIINVPDSNPSIKDRVLSVNDVMRDSRGIVHLKIHTDCKRLIFDYENVREEENGGIDKSNQALTHATDAEGYRIHYLRPGLAEYEPHYVKITDPRNRRVF
jgi:hypothetical protein